MSYIGVIDDILDPKFPASQSEPSLRCLYLPVLNEESGRKYRTK